MWEHPHGQWPSLHTGPLPLLCAPCTKPATSSGSTEQAYKLCPPNNRAGGHATCYPATLHWLVIPNTAMGPADSRNWTNTEQFPATATLCCSPPRINCIVVLICIDESISHVIGTPTPTSVVPPFEPHNSQSPLCYCSRSLGSSPHMEGPCMQFLVPNLTLQ
jgi:hypothetical protein